MALGRGQVWQQLWLPNPFLDQIMRQGRTQIYASDFISTGLSRPPCAVEAYLQVRTNVTLLKGNFSDSPHLARLQLETFWCGCTREQGWGRIELGT